MAIGAHGLQSEGQVDIFLAVCCTCFLRAYDMMKLCFEFYIGLDEGGQHFRELIPRPCFLLQAIPPCTTPITSKLEGEGKPMLVVGWIYIYIVE